MSVIHRIGITFVLLFNYRCSTVHSFTLRNDRFPPSSLTDRHLHIIGVRSPQSTHLFEKPKGIEISDDIRIQARKIRLESSQMEAELKRDKILGLTKQLTKLMANSSDISSAQEETSDLKRQCVAFLQNEAVDRTLKDDAARKRNQRKSDIENRGTSSSDISSAQEETSDLKRQCVAFLQNEAVDRTLKDDAARKRNQRKSDIENRGTSRTDDALNGERLEVQMKLDRLEDELGMLQDSFKVMILDGVPEMVTKEVERNRDRKIEDRLMLQAALSFLDLPLYTRRALQSVAGMDYLTDTTDDLNDKEMFGAETGSLNEDDDTIGSFSEEVMRRLYKQRDELLAPTSTQLVDAVNLSRTTPLLTPEQASEREFLSQISASIFPNSPEQQEDIANMLMEGQPIPQSVIDEKMLSEFITTSLPSRTRTEVVEDQVTELEAQRFFEKVLVPSKAFNPVSKPEPIPGGYILRGSILTETATEMINTIDAKLADTSLSDRVSYYLIRDPTPEMFNDYTDLWGKPVLFLTAKDISSKRNRWFLAVLTGAALVTTNIWCYDTLLANNAAFDAVRASSIGDVTGSKEDLEAALRYTDLWGKPVLFLTAKDISSKRNRWFLAVLTGAALVTTNIWCYDTLLANNAAFEAVRASSIGDVTGSKEDLEAAIALLTPNVAIMSAGLLGSQVVHELGHAFVAWKDKFKISAPTLFPFTNVPFLGASTDLRTSPPNLKSLFDFAYTGPALGYLTSLACLLYGLQLTATSGALGIDSATFPILSLDFLRQSTLIGGIVDMGLGSNVIVGQVPDASEFTVSLHPLAVAGYLGMMINAVTLLPVGHSDGGRIAMSIGGRNGLITFQSITFLIIFFAGLFGPDFSIFLGYGIVSAFFLRDIEIPMRNEIDDLDNGRAFLGIVTWFIVALTLIPMS
eukprot:CAMPEP_0194397090 /NCGR_PEP_ID=MMETSP0174-20130528/125351_1 /TAXON_ID=216777 /ORGANISM="Proboscia alata, Strain PI-D3" /LENGTH=915 /DNA_ID=CAMNT_0039193229 /DNA_START=87 /DNA_END=2835 /DNA_ORIENTATION=-